MLNCKNLNRLNLCALYAPSSSFGPFLCSCSRKEREAVCHCCFGMSLARESLVYTHILVHRTGELWVCPFLLLGPVKGTSGNICSHAMTMTWSLLARPGGRITLGIRAPAEVAATFLSSSPWTKDRLNIREWQLDPGPLPSPCRTPTECTRAFSEKRKT